MCKLETRESLRAWLVCCTLSKVLWLQPLAVTHQKHQSLHLVARFLISCHAPLCLTCYVTTKFIKKI